MNRTAVLISAFCLVASAASGTAVVPKAATNLQSTISDRQSPVADRTDAVTIPQMLSYQGKLTDTLGVPVADTLYAIRFRLYAQASGGTQFWEEDQQVKTKGGLFSVLLGSTTPVDSVPSSGAAYLGMVVAGGPELTPRIRIGSAAFAYLSRRSASADLLQGKDTAAFVRTGQANSVTSAMVVDGTIAAADLGQMGASTGQVMKWTGSAWVPRNDSLGSADNAWVRAGSDSVLYTAHFLGIARGGAANLLYGNQAFTHVNLGVACTTGTSGQNYTDCTVGGGYHNNATGNRATIGGGELNTASGLSATVGGGSSNVASGMCTAVGGGFGNVANGAWATVGGGVNNGASSYATVPGGYYCSASGNRSFAAGCAAKARGAGAFVWSDSCDEGDSVRTATDNRWVARARGGVYFYTNLGMTTGSYLSAGGSSWNSVSDSMTKENFRTVDRKALLEALAKMRVRDYNLKSQDKSIRHIGPVAQDFHNAFGFGESNTAINMEDADGVALAAIQALYEDNRQLRQEVEALKAKLAGQ